MIFENKYDGIKWFLNYREVDDHVISFWTEYEHKDWKFGDYILIQHIIDGQKISRPMYGIFTNFTVWDQALVLQFVQPKRAWTHHHSYYYKYNDQKFENSYYLDDDEVTAIQFWTDNIFVLGHWKSKPNRAQLREALSKEIRPKYEIRDEMLSSFLK